MEVERSIDEGFRGRVGLGGAKVGVFAAAELSGFVPHRAVVILSATLPPGLSWGVKNPGLWPGFHDAGFERPVLSAGILECTWVAYCRLSTVARGVLI